MKALRSISRGLWRVTLMREDAAALGVARIAIVAMLLANLLSHVGAISDYFSDASVLPAEFAKQAFGNKLSLFSWVTSPWGVRLIFIGGVITHLSWLAGFLTPICAVASMALWISMVGRHPQLYAFPDQLTVALGTLLALLPAGRGCSVDSRVFAKSRLGRALFSGAGRVPVWCRHLLQLQLAVMYVATGWLKSGAGWEVEGSAIYYSLVNPYNRHVNWGAELAMLQPWVLRPATYVTLWWERLFGVFLLIHWLREALKQPRWLPDLRLWVLGYGILMHSGIQALMYVEWFTPTALAGYVSFLSPQDWERLRAWRNIRASRLVHNSP